MIRIDIFETGDGELIEKLMKEDASRSGDYTEQRHPLTPAEVQNFKEAIAAQITKCGSGARPLGTDGIWISIESYQCAAFSYISTWYPEIPPDNIAIDVFRSTIADK